MIRVPADRAQRVRRRRVSVQPRAAVEFQGGASQISFDQIVHDAVVLADHRQRCSRLDRDDSVWRDAVARHTSAATCSTRRSSARRARCRGSGSAFEASPTFGTLNFTGLLADYRRYFMPANVLYARRARDALRPVRRDARGHRIFPLYIGYPWLVRGYDVGSFSADECLGDGTSSCPAIDRLIGKPHAHRQRRVQVPAAASVWRIREHVRAGAG